MLNTLHKVEVHENHVTWIYLTTVLCVGECLKYASKMYPHLPPMSCDEYLQGLLLLGLIIIG